VLASLGCAGGVMCAAGLVAAAAALLPSTLAAQTMNPIDLDARALALAAAAGLGSVLLAGLLPAWVGTRRDARLEARPGGRTGTDTLGARRLTRLLLVSEFALACTLMIGGALLVRSVLHLTRLPLGYDPRGLVTVELVPRSDVSPAVQRLRELLAAQPGIEAVAFSHGSPLRPAAWNGGQVTPDSAGAAAVSLQFNEHFVDRTYFDLYGIRLLEGRTFQPGDTPQDVILGASMAGALWSDERAVGRAFTFADRVYRVIGVADETIRPLVNPQPEQVSHDFYRPYQPTRRSLTLTYRCSSGCPSEGTFRQWVQREVPDVSISEFLSLEAAYHDDLAQPRATAALGTGFAVIALVAAAGGLFSVLSYAVNRRRREIGIRLALGSSPRAIRALVFRDAAGMALFGSALGGLLGWFLSRAIASLQYGVAVADVLTWLPVVVVLSLATLLASWWPARDAMRTDPLALLREE
jgi:predicted permease